MNGIKKRKSEVTEHQLYISRPWVWRKLKRDNNIDEAYAERAKTIDRFSRYSGPLQRLQDILYIRKINKVSLKETPPVFILGHWRSGTTLLHYIMARDPQFGYLCNFQAFVFNIAFLSKTVLRKISKYFIPKTRPQDNVKLSPEEPAEEEQAFSTLSPYSGIHSFYFPRNTSYFERYNLFKGITEKERKRWQKHYLFLLKSIALFSGKNKLLLKNPHNTGRVKQLLELFPDAKFIFIHRNPYVVYQSTQRLYAKMVKTQFLQKIEKQALDQSILDNFSATLGQYIEQRELIPKSNLIEIAFNDLENTPLKTVENIYSTLSLSGFGSAKKHFVEYLQSVKNYKKNSYPNLSEKEKITINKRLSFVFKTFGYQPK